MRQSQISQGVKLRLIKRLLNGDNPKHLATIYGLPLKLVLDLKYEALAQRRKVGD